MKNHKTLGLLVGTTCLATIAMTQSSRPGDAPAQERQPATSGQASNMDSLMMVQQRFHQAVASELRSGASKHDVKVDEGAVMISLVGSQGIIAGAPSHKGAATSTDTQRRAGETPTGREAGNTGREAGQPGGATGTEPGGATGTQTRTNMDSNERVLGVVVLSRGLAPAAGSALPGTDRTPGAPGADAEADAQKREREAAAGTKASGSNELVAFEVRQSAQGEQVELVDESGRVAMRVKLLGQSHDATGLREASAPRPLRDGANADGGDPLRDPRTGNPQGNDPQGRNPQGADRTRPSTGTDGDMAHAGSTEWSVVYASVISELCQKHHGKK